MAKVKTNAEVANKHPELAKAKKALEKYLKENKLDPTKDWTKDPKHGKAVTKLVMKLNKERDKVAAKYPETDSKSMKYLAKKAKKVADKKIMVSEIKNKKEKATSNGRTKYTYPLIDGREMTPAEKKKYRQEQRSKLNKKNDCKGKDEVKLPEKKKKVSKVDEKVKKGKKKVKREED